MEEYLSFRKFITPVIVQVLFWVGVVFAIIGGLITVFQGQILGGLVMLILGPLMVRVYCELLMLAFRIYDTLVEIRDGKRGGFGASAADTAPPPPPGAPM